MTEIGTKNPTASAEERSEKSKDSFIEDALAALASLSDVGKYFRTYCFRSVSELGFSANEIDVLLSLDRHPEKNTVKSLSETVHLSKGMISQAVERLRQRKFVTVDTDKKDRRSVRVRLAGASRPVLDRLLSDYVDFVNRMFHGVSKEHLSDAFAVLKQLSSNKEAMKHSEKNERGAVPKAADKQ